MKSYLILIHAIQQLYLKRFDLNFTFTKNIDYNFEQWKYKDWLHFINNLHKYKNIKTSDLIVFLSICNKQKLIDYIITFIHRALSLKIKIITYADINYPKLLSFIDTPPYIIFCLGNSSLLNNPKCVSIVGSRKAYYEALEMSYSLGFKFAIKNHVVVSGGAYGCDIMAHKGVYNANTENCLAIIVFANPLNNLYPKGNENYFQSMLKKNACFISEKIIDNKTYPSDFVYRNRIISGLSHLSFIMDAGKKSGALITAQNALDQGRDVIAFRPQKSKESDGIKRIIFEGAPFFSKIKELEGQYI